MPNIANTNLMCYRPEVIREANSNELVWLGFYSLRYHIKVVSRELVIVHKQEWNV